MALSARAASAYWVFVRRIALAIACLCAFPSVAGAQGSTAPPGNAGIGEYVETVPAAGGSRTSRDPKGNPARGGTLAPSAREELEALGEDGAALAEAIESTGPARRETAGSGGTSGSAAAPALQDSSESPLSSVLRAATGGSGDAGMGALLPIILAATLALFLAAALTRRRAS